MNAQNKPQYVIGRVYNRNGASDYFSGWDSNDHKTPVFSAKAVAERFTNHNIAYGMTIRLKRICPTISGGFPANYEVVELEETHEAA